MPKRNSARVTRLRSQAAGGTDCDHARTPGWVWGPRWVDGGHARRGVRLDGLSHCTVLANPSDHPERLRVLRIEMSGLAFRRTFRASLRRMARFSGRGRAGWPPGPRRSRHPHAVQAVLDPRGWRPAPPRRRHPCLPRSQRKDKGPSGRERSSAKGISWGDSPGRRGPHAAGRFAPIRRRRLRRSKPAV